jgi:ribonuclease HII
MKTIEMIDNLQYEQALYEQGITLIAGVDEVGRGPLVGPVVASAVILPINYHLEGLTDSKKLSAKKREQFYDIIMHDAISIGIGIIDHQTIDRVNIYQASKLAMIQAIKNLSIRPDYILSDAMKLDIGIPVTDIVKGDLLSISISAASVIAKVTRDKLMDMLDEQYPLYDFKHNKGYPTKKHIQAIQEHGIIEEHRRTYGPVSEYLDSQRV